MKGGFEAFDVIAIVSELKRTIVGYRLINAYDSNSKTYMLKLSSTNDDAKCVLLIESGVRMHITEFSWPKEMMPLGFTMKLRKHIKNKRLSNIRQLGLDRIVDLQFGAGDYAYHLIVELYGKGNIFLTDSEFVILNLLRPRTDVNQDVRYATRERYPVELARPIPDALLEIEDETLCLDKMVRVMNNLLTTASGPWNSACTDKATELVPVTAALSAEFPCGSGVLEHCCCLVGLGKTKSHSVSSSTPPVTDDSESCRLEYCRRLASSLRSVLLDFLRGTTLNEPKQPAVILGVKDPQSDKLIKYEAYYPMLFEQHRKNASCEFSTFNRAVDEFYSSMETKKAEVQVVQSERKAVKKVDNVRKDQEQRLAKLKEEQVICDQKASLIKLNSSLVDGVIIGLNSAIANQAPWTLINSIIDEEKRRGNTPFSCIEKLQLDLNQVILHLSDPYANTNLEDALPSLDVQIDLNYNASKNAERYYGNRRFAKEKESKTISGIKCAMKIASKKADKNKKEGRDIPRITKAREPCWFEKFHWFISSENYLVLAGRDAAQNENLIKRYFKPHDIYVHADIHGASSVIVKARPLQPNETPDPGGNQLPMPPMKTLIEAGQMAVTLSSAWTAKVITNAWWVNYDQVSKTAPSGEYLSTGSFTIRGRKNLLPQCHLVYGFGVLFKLADDSIERHLHERSINRETEKSALSAVKNYDIQQEEDDSHQHDDDLTNVFNNVILNLDINRPSSKLIKPMPPNLPISSEKSKKKSNAISSIDAKSINEKLCKKSQPVLKRGQKAKLRRIKEKYCDQDDAERQMCMELLQGTNAKLSAIHQMCAQPNPESHPSAETAHSSENGSISSLEPADDDYNEEEEQNPPKNVSSLQSKEYIDATNDGDDESEKKTTPLLDILDRLTGQPHPDDTILLAMPFCAPFSALSNCKYKAKLTPGTQKRGKVTKVAIHRFSTNASATLLEKQLIQSIKEEDVCRVFPGSAKITFPELTTTSIVK